jgi:hypothetical protein
MLRVLGSPTCLGEGVSRRALLQAGAALPLLAGSVFGDQAAPKAKRILLLYLYGAAAQHETWDPKPDAPAEIRGDFKPISTALPGIAICEHLPKMAEMLDQVTVIRSMTHPYNIHSAGYTMTGVDFVDIPMETNAFDGRHWPSFQSILDYLHREENPSAPLPAVPFSVGMPFPFTSRLPGGRRAGPYGGFLGQNHNPVWTNFEGKAVHTINRWLGGNGRDTSDPYAGITSDSKLTVSSAAILPPEVTIDRLDRRRSLLSQFETELRQLDEAPSGRSLNRFQEMAYSMLTSKPMREALDLTQEPMPLRERYGMTLFGQSTLAARRMLEAGAKVVTVMWDEFETVNSSWDTHFDHYDRLKNELLPGLDSALSTLLTDMGERGMLDDTLVLCLTEHGRTPKLSLGARGVGREHWSNSYCNLLAGAGIAKGKIIGASDDQGAFVKENPIDPKDILCTLYHLLGIDPHTTVPDRFGRPYPLVSRGRVLTEVLGS